MPARRLLGTPRLLAAALSVAACSASGGGSELPKGSSGGSGGSAAAGGSGAEGGSGGGAATGAVPGGGTAGILVQDGGGSGGSGGSGATGDACAAVGQEAKPQLQPVDIVWAIDTSGSMIEEALLVQNNINSFSQQIVASGIDVHVVMLAGYPFFFLPGICVPAPLGSGVCPPNGTDTLLPHFWHHPTAIVESVDAAVKLVSLFPDYASMLRPGAPKHLVVVTDDDSHNAADHSGDAGVYNDNPDGFIADYTALDPMLSDANGDRTWKLSAIYAFSMCANAAAIGNFWKQVVDTTGGVHGDLCSPNLAAEFQKVFDELAQQIIIGAQPLDCQWQIPPPPAGQTFDPAQVNVEFTDGQGAVSTIYFVDSAAACDPVSGGWYYDDPAAPTAVVACPATCATIQAEANAKIQVLFGCATQVQPPK
jgi:hypothetical protein